MKYFYIISTVNLNDMMIDEITPLLSQQARISTRRRSERWELKLHSGSISIRFLHKYDRDDFLAAFETANDEFLKRHGVCFAGHYAWPSLLDRAERFLVRARARPRK